MPVTESAIPCAIPSAGVTASWTALAVGFLIFLGFTIQGCLWDFNKAYKNPWGLFTVVCTRFRAQVTRTMEDGVISCYQGTFGLKAAIFSKVLLTILV